MTVEAWDEIRDELRKAIGKDAFRNWIEPLDLVSVDLGTATFSAPTRFIGDWVGRNFGDSIRSGFRGKGMEVDRVVFETDGEVFDSAEPGQAQHDPARSPIPDSGLPGAPFDRRFTFESFVVGQPNQLAHAAARRVAEQDEVSFNPVFLYGGVGLGKTHLMHAIAWEVQDLRPDAQVVYLSAEQFVYKFVQALRSRNTMDFKALFRSVDVLMVDDVQFVAGKESTQDEFFHTFNELVGQQKQIVISGDREPGEIDGLDERIKSRLQSGLIVDLHPTDYELRLGILQSKSEAQLGRSPGVQIEDGVLEFLAQRVSTNVRVLEGALNRLFAFASLVGKTVDLNLTRECLSDILRASSRKTTVDEVIRKVSEHYNVKMTDIVGPRRARAVSRPRQVAMYLADKLTTKSLQEIGRRFGGRDHTTVIYAIRRTEERKLTDHQIAEDLEILRRSLEA